MPIPDAKFDGAPVSLNSRARGHLNGRIPVLDIEALMGDDTDDTAFIIVRTVECSQASVLVAQAGGLLRWTEDIFMKSQVSKNALGQIATCHFQPGQEDQELRHHSSYLKETTSKSDTPLLDNIIVPADLFLFHHREALGHYITEHTESKQHINAVLEYMNHRFGSEFADADNLFANGVVTRAHVLHLFKPNEVVISGSHGRPAAFILHEWPEMNRDGWITLRCWSFQTDGSGFARKSTTISVPPVGSEPIKIQELVAYPLRFAASELHETIRSRGKKHWQLRKATQVTYKGWNVRGDQYFVGSVQAFARNHLADLCSPTLDL